MSQSLIYIQLVSNREEWDGRVGPGKGQWRNIIRFEMIDFLKAQIIGPTIEELINHPLLDFHAKVNVSTGEVNTDIQIAEYRNFKFITDFHVHILP